MDYLIHIGVLIAIYAILTASLDLLVGHAGLISLAHAAFFGIGAYTSALTSIHWGLSFPLGVLLGMSLAAVLSLLISVPSFRLRDNYFVVSTFALQVITFNIFNNWTGLTRGPLGIPAIPPPSLLGYRFDTPLRFLVLGTAVSAFAYFVVCRIAASPYGRVLHAIREDELFAQSLGKRTYQFKVSATAVSASLAACAGCLYAHYITYIDPTSFTVMDSILILAMAVLGGCGGRWGPLLGAALLVLLPEALRFAGLPTAVAAYQRQIIYGSLLVLLMIFRPQGLVGEYRFER